MVKRKRKSMSILIAIGLAITMIFAVVALSACNTDLTLSQQADNLGQQVYAAQNGGNPTIAEIDALLAELEELRAEVIRLDGENVALLTRIAGYEAQLKAFLQDRENDRLNADLVLTISVKNATITQGQDFRVNVELKNQSGEGREVSWAFGFFPHIQGYIDYIDPNFNYPYILELEAPEPRSQFLENNEILRNLSVFGVESPDGIIISTSGLRLGTVDLSRGTHSLRFHFGRSTNIIWSNTIIITVQ